MLNRILAGALIVVALLAIISIPAVKTGAQGQVGDQNLLNMSFISAGVSAKGARVLQTGEVSTLSASIASATAAKLATAPASGSIYLRAILVEKAATASSGSTITLSYGTGTNCGTGTTTLLGPVTAPPAGYLPLGILVPAGKDLCAATDAATTVARVLTN
jgi:hypothetical protein